MLTIAKKNINDILKTLPSDANVIDIGGSSVPFKRANTIIDAVPWESINWQQEKGPGERKFSKDTYIQHDICAREAWPIKDKEFDYSVCSHVLEDIRDPLWVCHEIIRISKAGYIEIPSRLYETTFGVEIATLAGASHHRWVIDLEKENVLRFTFKYMHIHSHVVNKNKQKYNKGNPEMYLCIEWKDSFDFKENWLNSGKEIFEFYLDKNITEKEKWQVYRKTDKRGFIKGWLSYLKNTNKTFSKIFNKIKRK